jgi:hypothetical protein
MLSKQRYARQRIGGALLAKRPSSGDTVLRDYEGMLP